MYLTKHHAMKMHGGEEVYIRALLTSVLGEARKWSASRPGHFISGERSPCTQQIWGWVDHRGDVDVVAKRKNSPLLPGNEPPSFNPQPSRYTDWPFSAPFDSI